MIVALVSSAILGSLLFLHVRTYRRLATRFGLGLMAFAAILLVQNLYAVYSYFTWEAQRYNSQVAIPMLVLSASGLGAFLILFWLTWE